MNLTHFIGRDLHVRPPLLSASFKRIQTTKATSLRRLSLLTFNGTKLLCTCLLFVPIFAHAQNQNWESWFSSQINKHPDIVAAKEQLLSTGALADASERALYNPELSIIFEKPIFKPISAYIRNKEK